MHELSVSSAIVATAVRHAEGRRVTAVHVRLGHLRQVVPSSLAFYWDIVSRETVCEGSVLHQEVVPAALGCKSCGERTELLQPIFRCAACGSGDVEVLSGEELEVEFIEVEEEAGCTV